MGHPRRLTEFLYQGPMAVFITTCTDKRHHAFVNHRVVTTVTTKLLTCAQEQNVEVTAYVAMPDHHHMLLTGL